MTKLSWMPALALLASAFSWAPETDPTRYVLDRSHTTLGFSARHMLVTNVRGKFNDFSGEILLDEQNIENSSVQVTIRTASIDTDHERRDTHLRSDDFFNAELYPEITFVSKRVIDTGEGLMLVGDLTIRDNTREVTIPFELTGPVDTGQGQKRIGIAAELRVNRFDWGLKWDRAIETGGLVVSEEVTLELNIAAATPRQ